MYELRSTTLVSGSCAAVWTILTDVAHWADWDPHEEAARISGPFVAGSKGWSKPHGGPAADWLLTQVTSGESWSTECGLPAGKLSGTTTLTPMSGGRVQVTRVMRATGPFSLLFRYYFGPRIQRDLELTWAALQRELDKENLDSGTVVEHA
jgi:hypothetical protein